MKIEVLWSIFCSIISSTAVFKAWSIEVEPSESKIAEVDFVHQQNVPQDLTQSMNVKYKINKLRPSALQAYLQMNLTEQVITE